MNASRHRALALALCAILIGQPAAPVFAHNERIHQQMTDYAYHLALAMADVASGNTKSNALVAELGSMLGDHPDLPSFFAAARDSVPKLRALRSGLADDLTPCTDPDLKALVDDNNDGVPDWPFMFPLADQPMAAVIYPVTTNYANKNAHCEFDKRYQPIGAMTLVNPITGASAKEQFRSRDHTGMTLGYWAGAPDRALNDWIYRSTTLEALKTPAVQTGAGAGSSALVMAACTLACGLVPVLCGLCPVIAVGAGNTVIDQINDLNASAMDHSDFTGLSHHIDVKPLQPGDAAFDDNRGKFMEKAGPNGSPDTLEDMVMSLYEFLGWHLRHDLSDGPKNYEIAVTGTSNDDGRPDSVPRSAVQWQTANGAHIQYTPVDNLALWGWKEFKDSGSAKRFGWSLHALGDASVPMHTVGATGYGHRPYEDSFDNRWEELVIADLSRPGAVQRSARQAREIVKRALVWRQYVLQWRAGHGGTTDIPVRDLVTLLAEQTRGNAAAVTDLYNSSASLTYFFVSESLAKQQYNSQAIVGFQQDRGLEAVAATLALLISGMEVVQ